MAVVFVYAAGAALTVFALQRDWISLDSALLVLAIAVFLNRLEIAGRIEEYRERIAMLQEKVTAISKRLWPDDWS